MKLIKRKLALKKGLTYYFTNRACKHGHIAERRAINGCCTECEKVKNNSSNRKEYMTKYAEQNRLSLRKTASRWQKNNKGKVNANTALKHTAKLLRTPKWLTDFDKLHIQCLYQVAAMRTRESGYAWHVDHVIPLQGKTVSGLHVPSNLRVIPALDNISKGNRYNG